ncbi:hypothetical protein CGK74_14530 [Thauera propionica]|uniref:Uncharacterized protein n=1 Tax=Thauera propionica TaxID=2019431 RepID=A0A235EVM3_9RHOO|nr:hypothetical protein CGK74_14530 [Thauera propionica]
MPVHLTGDRLPGEDAVQLPAPGGDAPMLALDPGKLRIIGAGSISSHPLMQGVDIACDPLQRQVSARQSAEGMQTSSGTASKLQQAVKVGAGVLYAPIQRPDQPGAQDRRQGLAGCDDLRALSQARAGVKRLHGPGSSGRVR